MLRHLLIASCLGLAGLAWAQGQPPVAAAAPAAPAASAAMPGVQNANIFEIRPDASADLRYAEQSNAERARVQPGNNAPMWREVGRGASGHSSLPKAQAPEAGNLVQPFVQYPGSRLTTAGEAWRQVRNRWILPYGGALLLIVAVAIALFHWRKGTIALHGAETGRRIERFTPFERAAHWTNAIAFSLLALSGLVMAFGKFFLLPVLGLTLHGWLVYLLKNIHNFAGPLFAVSLVVVFLSFLRDNLPRREDLSWLLEGGGLLSGAEPPSHRFNAGEKLVFWGGVFLLGAIVVASGLVLDRLVPGLVYARATMQVAHMVHAVATLLMIALFLGHIYMGTLGMQGAYQAMRSGYVDETWAREHHELWYEDIQAGRIPAERSAPAAGGQTVEA
ncbi:formate dehydrogenase subunit gamma [Ramlibacter sp. 2FC]|uniref:formate dehydrogenase subunit gamma n=1 Tax=Ramlibacter sp. 2FC TaxID=2502188 RepID=UPI0010F985A0|nr:formate dehydrogenase subunit gamma [Ramlibacter sp. 2FC]